VEHLDWLRLYTNTLESNKIQSLPPTLFRTWVNLLCVCRIFDGTLPDNSEIAFRLRTSRSQAEKSLSELRGRGLIDQLPDGRLTMHDWEQHQYESDDAATRQRRYREKKKTTPLRNVSRDRDATCPVPEQSRTEQTQNRPESVTGAAVDRMYALHPKKRNLVLVLPALEAQLLNGFALSEIESCHAEWCKSKEWTKEGGRFAPKLDEWIADRGFTGHPNGSKPEPDEYYDGEFLRPAEAERRRALKKANGAKTA
jgi:hypothetical protein